MLADPSGAIAPGITDAMFARLAADCGYPVIHLSGNAIHKSFCSETDNRSEKTMRGRARSCSSVFLSILGLIFLASNGEAATAEESLANLNHLPPADRQANLVKQATQSVTAV